MYGDRTPAAVRDAGHINDHDAARLGVRMLHDVIAHADRVWVQSEFARTVVTSEAAAHGLSCPPIHVVPFPFPAPFAPRRGPRVRGLIVSMGVVSSVKHCDRIVAALPRVRDAVPESRLVFVGPVGDAERDWLKNLASSFDVAEAVEFTGAVDPDVYADWLLRADVAVQLREISNGEGSFTAAEAMSNGVPVVVSDVGWCGELPSGAVEKAPVGGSASDLAARVGRLMTMDEEERDALTGAAITYAGRHTFAAMATAIMAAGRPGGRPAGDVG
jgi:glycosyltransferase involved in cell wall biosynthesis